MRTRSCLSIGTIVLAAWLGRGGALASPPEIVQNGKEARKADFPAPWMDLESGLKKARKSGQPMIVLYASAGAGETPTAGGDSSKVSDLAGTFEGCLSDSSFKRTMRDYVAVRLEPADLDEPFPPREESDAPEKRAVRRKRAPARPAAPPETIGQKLGLKAEKSTLLVLSFREQEVKRYLDELPKRSALRKELARIEKVNKVFLREDRRVGAILEKSLYAFKLGKRKAAVALVVPFTKPSSRQRMDDALQKRVDDVIDGYRKVAATEMKEGDLLDGKQKYKEALDVFERVLQDFAFPDIRKDAAIRKGEVWRKVQLISRIPR